jgi:hypothetical protein
MTTKEKQFLKQFMELFEENPVYAEINEHLEELQKPNYNPESYEFFLDLAFPDDKMMRDLSLDYFDLHQAISSAFLGVAKQALADEEYRVLVRLKNAYKNLRNQVIQTIIMIDDPEEQILMVRSESLVNDYYQARAQELATNSINKNDK